MWLCVYFFFCLYWSMRACWFNYIIFGTFSPVDCWLVTMTSRVFFFISTTRRAVTTSNESRNEKWFGLDLRASKLNRSAIWFSWELGVRLSFWFNVAWKITIHLFGPVFNFESEKKTLSPKPPNVNFMIDLCFSSLISVCKRTKSFKN